MPQIPFPRTGAPALRALEGAGYSHLQELDGIPMRSVLALHGMGPKAIGALRRAMADHDWAFADDDPAVGATLGGRVAITEGVRPEPNDNTTLVLADGDPAEWIAGLPKARQREDGRVLLTLFGSATGAPAMMWGPSIVGYGELHYVYESGREGDMPRVAFSPRAAANSLYIGAERRDPALLQRLGKHRLGASCLYVNKLADIDLDVLRDLIGLAWRDPLTPFAR